MPITLAQSTQSKHLSLRVVIVIREETILAAETVGEQVGSDIIETGGKNR
jgi:hypothetical protein